jgi:hypothetical protein
MHSPLSQLALHLVTCHTPSIVGVVSRGALSALHTSEELAARPRVITAICVLRFIFVPFVDMGFVVLAFFDCSSLSCHFWPFTEIQNGNEREVTRRCGKLDECSGGRLGCFRRSRQQTCYYGVISVQVTPRFFRSADHCAADPTTASVLIRHS